MVEQLDVVRLTVDLPTAQGWVRPVNEVSLRIGARIRQLIPIHFQPIQ